MAAKDYVINISGDTGKLEAAVKSADGQIRALNDNQVVISMDIEAGDIAKVRNAIQQMVNQDPTVNIQLSYELDKKNLEIAKKQVEELKNEYQEIWQNPNTKKSKDYLQGQVRSQAKAIDEALKGGAKQKDVINNYKALLRYAQSVKDATGIKNLDDDIEDLFGDIGKRGKQLQTATEDFFDGKIVGGYIDILRDKIGDVNKHINDLGSNITRLKRMGAQDYEGDGPISGLGEYVNTFERIAQMVRSLRDIEIPSLDKSGSMEDRAQRLKELAIEYDEAGKAIQSFQEQADGSTESQDQLALLQKYQFEVLKAYNKTLKAVGGNKNQTDFLKKFFPENTDFDIAYEDEEGIFEDIIHPIQKRYGDAFREAMQEGGVVLDLDKLFEKDFQNLYDTELEKIMSGIEESVDKRLAGIEEDTAATEKNTESHRENNEEKQKAEDSSSTQQQTEQIKQDTEETERNTEAHRENNEEKERASETDNTQQTEQTKQDTEETERNTEAHRENNEEKERASESAETQDKQTEQTRQNTEETEKNTEAHRENNEEKQKASETTSDQEKQTQQTQENTSKTEENTEQTRANTEEKEKNAKASEEQAQADEKAAKAAEEKAEAEKKASQAADEAVNKTTTESSEGIGKEAQQFEDIATNARNAADAKADFVAANILVAQSAQESAEAINKEVEALGKVAGAAGEAASGKSKLESSEGKRKSGGGGKKSTGAKVEEEDPAEVYRKALTASAQKLKDKISVDYGLNAQYGEAIDNVEEYLSQAGRDMEKLAEVESLISHLSDDISTRAYDATSQADFNKRYNELRDRFTESTDMLKQANEVPEAISDKMNQILESFNTTKSFKQLGSLAEKVNGFVESVDSLFETDTSEPQQDFSDARSKLSQRVDAIGEELKSNEDLRLVLENDYNSLIQQLQSIDDSKESIDAMEKAISDFQSKKDTTQKELNKDFWSGYLSKLKRFEQLEKEIQESPELNTRLGGLSSSIREGIGQYGVSGFAQDIETLENGIKVAKADIKSTVDKIKTSFKELGTDGKGLFGAISSGDVDTLFGFQQKLTNANDLVDSFGKAYGAEAIDKYKLSGLSSSLIQGVLKNFRENIEKQIGAQVKTLDKNEGSDLTNSAKYVLETARADLSRASDQAKSLTDFDIDGMLEIVRTVTNAGKRISDVTSDMSGNKYVDTDSVNKAINNITETLSNAAPGEARDKLEAIKSSLQEMKGAADAAGESFVKITEADFADTTSQVKELSDAIKETTKYDNREANDLTDSYRAMGALGKDYLSALESDNTGFIDSYTTKLEQLRGRFEMLKSSLGESAPQVVKVQAAMDNYERGMSKMFDSSFGSQFESRIEKINKALVDPKYTTEFKANLTECKTTLESMSSEFDSISLSSEKSFSSDTIQSFVRGLKDADSTLEKLNNKSNVYASAGQVDNLLRKVNKDIESMSLSGEVKDGYIELQKALQGISEEASKAADGMAKISKERMTGFSDTWKNLNQKAIAQGMNQPKFLNQFRSAITNQSAQFLGQYFSLQDFVRYGRELAQTVISIDTGMTELRKVSGETDTRLDQSFKASAASAKEYGATITDIIKSTADWSRLNNTRSAMW